MSADTKLILSLVNRIAVRVSRTPLTRLCMSLMPIRSTASLQQWPTHRLLGERSTHTTNVNAVIDISSRILISLLISLYCYGSHVLPVVGITSSSRSRLIALAHVTATSCCTDRVIQISTSHSCKYCRHRFREHIKGRFMAMMGDCSLTQYLYDPTFIYRHLLLLYPTILYRTMFFNHNSFCCVCCQLVCNTIGNFVDRRGNQWYPT